MGTAQIIPFNNLIFLKIVILLHEDENVQYRFDYCDRLLFILIQEQN